MWVSQGIVSTVITPHLGARWRGRPASAAAYLGYLSRPLVSLGELPNYWNSYLIEEARGKASPGLDHVTVATPTDGLGRYEAVPARTAPSA